MKTFQGEIKECQLRLSNASPLINLARVGKNERMCEKLLELVKRGESEEVEFYNKRGG